MGQEFALEAGPTISLPNIIREGCHEDAYDMVNKNNNPGLPASSSMTPSSVSNSPKTPYVQNPKILGLISSFTALMLHIKKLSEGDRNSFELEALTETLREVKGNICPENVGKFENCVEVHVKHMQSGLSQMGNLHAFMKNSTPSKAGKILNASMRVAAGSGAPSGGVNSKPPHQHLTPVVMNTDSFNEKATSAATAGSA